jgi:hypothetical protein
MYEIDVDNCSDDELRDALYNAVLTGNETANVRKDIKELYALMNRTELMSKVTGPLYGKPRYRQTPRRELLQRQIAEERRRVHKPAPKIVEPVIPVTWTPAESFVNDLLAIDIAATMFDSMHVGVTSVDRKKVKKIAHKNNYTGEIIYHDE